MRDILSDTPLADLADVSRLRKKKICRLFCTVACGLLLAYSYINFQAGHLLIAAANACGVLLCLLDLYPLYKTDTQYRTPVAFNLALAMNAAVTILQPTADASQIFWVYPAVVALIYLNEFKTSVMISLLLCLLACVSFWQANHWENLSSQDNLYNDRMLISLIITSFICLSFSYYHSHAIRYLQKMYISGIEELAYKDRLTGLANRWSFENWANKTLEEQRYCRSTTALVFLDIDNFKCINDSYGHDAGDRVLQYFSKRLSNNVRTASRNNDQHIYSVARYAGDEFILLLDQLKNRQDLEKIVSRISKLFCDDLKQSELPATLTFSMGIAIYKEDADTLEELIRCADKAMYMAKKSGKNRYMYYKIEDDTQKKVRKLHIV